jgi:murein tripeptide amidase MpaA
MRHLTIWLFLAALTFAQSSAQNQTNDERLLQIVKDYGQAEVTMNVTGQSQIDYLSRHLSILNLKGNTIEISLSPVTVTWFLSQHYLYTIKEKITPRGLVSASSMEKALTWDTYPTYTQYDSIMRSFAQNYPDLCRLDTIGTSIRGKLVLAVKITGSGSSDSKPEVFYSSTMHGDETGGFILMLRLADYLLKNYQVDPRVKELMDNLQIWINPLANPDGTYNNGNVIISPVRYNFNGIDLNRNFPDPLIADQTLEKENVDMVSFLRKHRFVISANFHAGEELVNYPWDRWLDKFHPDDTWYQYISRAYADTAHLHSPEGYMTSLDNGITRGAVWYVVYGGRQDFVTQQLHGREVTIELDYIHTTPVNMLSTLWESNWRSLLGYLENALYGIHGLVLDSDSNTPVPAEVFIHGHDVDSSQVYADTTSGRFVRMIASGIWPLTFSASGYRDTTINVTVNEAQRNDLTVLMKKVTVPPDTLDLSPKLYPNPASSVINVTLPEALTGNVVILVTDQTGRVVIGYTTDISAGEVEKIDISRLVPGVYQAEFRNIKRKTTCRSRFVVIK